MNYQGTDHPIFCQFVCTNNCVWHIYLEDFWGVNIRRLRFSNNNTLLIFESKALTPYMPRQLIDL